MSEVAPAVDFKRFQPELPEGGILVQDCFDPFATGNRLTIGWHPNGVFGEESQSRFPVAGVSRPFIGLRRGADRCFVGRRQPLCAGIVAVLTKSERRGARETDEVSESFHDWNKN